MTLQPWLLQHYTGTTGLRVELMLANMVAEKYTNIYEVDWVEVRQGVFGAHLRKPEEHLHEPPSSEC